MSLKKYTIYNPSIKNEFVNHFDSLLDSFMNYNFPSLTEEVNDDFFQRGTFPKVNIFSDKDSFVIQASVAGYKKEDVSIQVKDDLLIVSGKTNDDIKPKDAKFYFREVKLSNFTRTFKLNDFLNKDKVSARIEDGLLTITIPYKDKKSKKNDVVNIKIN